LAAWLRPTPDRLVRFRLFAALVPLITWTGYVATAYATNTTALAPSPGGGAHPEGAVELYTGMPIVQGLLGLLLAVLLVPTGGAPTAAPSTPTSGLGWAHGRPDAR
jgi:hypothetical protein